MFFPAIVNRTASVLSFFVGLMYVLLINKDTTGNVWYFMGLVLLAIICALNWQFAEYLTGKMIKNGE